MYHPYIRMKGNMSAGQGQGEPSTSSSMAAGSSRSQFRRGRSWHESGFDVLDAVVGMLRAACGRAGQGVSAPERALPPLHASPRKYAPAQGVRPRIVPNSYGPIQGSERCASPPAVGSGR